jgi:hypothetical protein
VRAGERESGNQINFPSDSRLPSSRNPQNALQGQQAFVGYITCLGARTRDRRTRKRSARREKTHSRLSLGSLSFWKARNGRNVYQQFSSCCSIMRSIIVLVARASRSVEKKNRRIDFSTCFDSAFIDCSDAFCGAGDGPR